LLRGLLGGGLLGQCQHGQRNRGQGDAARSGAALGEWVLHEAVSWCYSMQIDDDGAVGVRDALSVFPGFLMRPAVAGVLFLLLFHPE
jgi:hypothetical protein